MPGPRICRLSLALLVTSAYGLVSNAARGDEAAPIPPRRPFARPDRDSGPSDARRTSGRPESSSNWWLGTAGVTLALAVCGWASVASRKLLPQTKAGAAGLRVVGRTSLSPRHAVYLLRAGDRVLIVGTGPQGPPSLLGELEAEDEVVTGGPEAGTAARVGGRS